MIPTNIYQLAIAKATPEEAAKLVEDMAAESEHYRVALESLRKDVSDVISKPDYTNPEGMVRKLRASLSNDPDQRPGESPKTL